MRARLPPASAASPPSASRVGVLRRAAAADAEVRAARRAPRAALAQDARASVARARTATSLARDLRFDALAGQRALDEHHLAFGGCARRRALLGVEATRCRADQASSRATGTRASAARRASRAVRAHQRALAPRSCSAVNAQRMQLEAQVEEIGVDACRPRSSCGSRAIAAGLVASQTCAPPMPSLPGKPASCATSSSGAPRAACTATARPSGRVAGVEAADVVVVAEVRVVVAVVPEARRRDAVDQRRGSPAPAGRSRRRSRTRAAACTSRCRRRSAGSSSASPSAGSPSEKTLHAVAARAARRR